MASLENNEDLAKLASALALAFKQCAAQIDALRMFYSEKFDDGQPKD